MKIITNIQKSFARPVLADNSKKLLVIPSVGIAIKRMPVAANISSHLLTQLSSRLCHFAVDKE
jgi:hypothetical protein